MKISRHRAQKGIALLLAVIALLLLTAIAASMIFTSNIDSAVNNNYRAEQQAYFAARAGIEEARFRMLRPVTGVTTPTNTADLFNYLPTNVPGQNGAAPKNTDMIYIINPGTQNNIPGGTVETVAPWDKSNAYFDDELCHENYQNYTPTNAGKGLRCTDTPYNGGGGSTYWRVPKDISSTLLNSYDPNSGTAGAMGYKWVRIALKQNWGNVATTVDGAITNMGAPSSYTTDNKSTICYTGSTAQTGTTGQQEVLLSKLTGYTSTCLPSSSSVKDLYRPVYIVTALGTTASGARRMLQAEVADSPPVSTNASLDTQSLVNINGSSVTIDGNDNCNCSCSIAKGSSAPTCTEISNGKTCTDGTEAIYSTQSISSGGAVVAPTNPTTTQNASSFPFDVNSLIQNYKALADQTNPSGVSFGVPPWGPNQATPSGDPGSPGEVPCNHTSSGGYDFTPPTTYTVGSGLWCPQVTYFSGNQTFQGLTGAGVLVIDGDLTLHGGGGAFYGLIIVKGTLTISGNGCGQSCGLIGGVITGTGTVSDNTDTIGGGVTIQYDHCALGYNQSVKEPSILAMRELSY
jgi:Tfp pilus assembly protein PilX